MLGVSPRTVSEIHHNQRHFPTESADPLAILDNPLAVRNAVARLIADVYGGRIHPKTGTGLAPLLNLQLRAIETTEPERRLAKLEKKLHAQLEGTAKR
jgi:hypothetical protein